MQQPAIRSWQWPTEKNHQSQSYNHTRSYQRNECQPFYGCLTFEANWKGEKSLTNWCVMSWLKILKSCHLKCCLPLVYAATTNHFSIRLWHAAKSEFYYDNQWQPAQRLELEEAPKHFSESNLYQKKIMVTARWPAAHLTHYSFLNPGETITSENMFSKLIRGTENCLWSTEKAQFFSRTMPDCTLHKQHFESWKNWTRKFCLICQIHLTSSQPTNTSLSISTTFCRKNASTTSKMQEMLSKTSLNPKAQIFMLQE